MYKCIDSDLDNLNDWFKANQLSVNPSKTKYILFTNKCGVDDQMHLPYIEGTLMDQVPCTTFLDIYIDEHLASEQHIDHCANKNVKWHILRILYYSLVHPNATYGKRLWGNTCQNKAIRDGKYLAPPHASAWQRSPH